MRRQATRSSCPEILYSKVANFNLILPKIAPSGSVDGCGTSRQGADMGNLAHTPVRRALTWAPAPLVLAALLSACAAELDPDR